MTLSDADRPLVVVVNGETRTFRRPPTLDEVLSMLGIERRGVAIAVDDQVIPRSAWSASTLRDGARVEIVTAAAGG